MAHQRYRYLKDIILKSIRFKGAVGVFGHRQVGKTTLIEDISQNYASFDSTINRIAAENNPEGFLHEHLKPGSKLPLAIDECQQVSAIFPAIKEWLRIHKNPGQILLSGSVRFATKKDIYESLAGRLITHELIPMSICEQEQRQLNDNIIRLCSADFRTAIPVIEKREVRRRNDAFKKYAEFGGLPGICFVRSEFNRINLLNTQLDAILTRDIRMVLETTLPVSTLRNLLGLLALRQGEPVNLAELARKSRISVPTLRKLLHAFETLFLIRIIPTEGGEVRPVVFLEDQGEANYLAPQSLDPMTQFLGVLFAQIRVVFSFYPELRSQLFQYRTPGGAFMPLCVRIKDHVVGLILCENIKPTIQAQKSAQSFLSNYKNAKVLFVHQGLEFEAFSANQASIPVALLI